MPLLRAPTYRVTRWKNGGGETKEIAISPAGAGLNDFDWRVSMATVSGDSDFSVFPGVDRTLCLISGAGIHLQVGDAMARRVDVESDPMRFSGDISARAALIDGPVTDFNVMTRRGRFTHSVERVHVRDGESHEVPPGVTVIFCQSGRVAILSHSSRDLLQPLDTFLKDTSDRDGCRLSGDASATVYLVSIVAL